jgi:hypothetical protein
VLVEMRLRVLEMLNIQVDTEEIGLRAVAEEVEEQLAQMVLAQMVQIAHLMLVLKVEQEMQDMVAQR